MCERVRGMIIARPFDIVATRQVTAANLPISKNILIPKLIFSHNNTE